MNLETKVLLQRLAIENETAEFLVRGPGDPSMFMHKARGKRNREATAFVASCLSFGSRKQFLAKIQYIVDCACGDVDNWIRTGEFEENFKKSSQEPFYRFYTFGSMYSFFKAYQSVLLKYGSLGSYVKCNAGGNALDAIKAICDLFSSVDGEYTLIPKNTQSACKRVCMFLRWMVRDSSPVDLGLWAKFVDKRTLIMPLDTHVLQQSKRLGLLTTANASMSTAKKLTSIVSEAFPDDPLKADFALFGSHS